MTTATVQAAQPHSSGATQSAHKSALLSIDASEFGNSFDRKPFLIGHNLIGHSLFDIDRMLQLARALPEKKVEYHAGELPIGLDPKMTPRNGLSAEETIRRLEECKSWMVLRNAELDPDYRKLLEDCMAEVAPLSEPIRPGMKTFEAFVILSSPDVVTPFHIDPEHNFLLQIRGAKKVAVFDRKLVSQERLEQFYCGAHRNLPYDESYMADAEVFDLPPGKGIHIPVTAPHWVINGKDISVSFSITFRTPELARNVDAFVMNERLRRIGLKPAPVGASPKTDQLKSVTLRAWRKSLRMTGLGRAS